MRHVFHSFYQITGDSLYLDPLIQTMNIFKEDFLDDQQYQLLALCGAKDAVVRTFFQEGIADQRIQLLDQVGVFGDAIPYSYREEVSPVTHAFATSIPQRISAMLLSLIPTLPEFLETLYDPINQIVLLGFVGGIVLSIAVIYVKRPKNQ